MIPNWIYEINKSCVSLLKWFLTKVLQKHPGKMKPNDSVLTSYIHLKLLLRAGPMYWTPIAGLFKKLFLKNNWDNKRVSQLNSSKHGHSKIMEGKGHCMLVLTWTNLFNLFANRYIQINKKVLGTYKWLQSLQRDNTILWLSVFPIKLFNQT